MKYITIILALILTGCAKEDDLMQETKEVEQHLRVSAPLDVLGTWYTDIDPETNPTPNAIYAYPQLDIRLIGKRKAVINNTDTVQLLNATEYTGSPLIHGQLNNGKITHCQLYPDNITSMSYYVCLEYTR
jgi:hypothetical protein